MRNSFVHECSRLINKTTDIIKGLHQISFFSEKLFVSKTSKVLQEAELKFLMKSLQ